jgi:hypothetical protein
LDSKPNFLEKVLDEAKIAEILQSQGKELVESSVLNNLVNQISALQSQLMDFRNEKSLTERAMLDERQRREHLEDYVGQIKSQMDRLKENAKQRPEQTEVGAGILSAEPEVLSENEDQYDSGQKNSRVIKKAHGQGKTSSVYNSKGNLKESQKSLRGAKNPNFSSAVQDDDLSLSESEDGAQKQTQKRLEPISGITVQQSAIQQSAIGGSGKRIPKKNSDREIVPESHASNIPTEKSKAKKGVNSHAGSGQHAQYINFIGNSGLRENSHYSPGDYDTADGKSKNFLAEKNIAGPSPAMQQTGLTGLGSKISPYTGIEAAGRWMNLTITEKARLTNAKRRIHKEKQALEKKKYNLKIHELEMQQELQRSNLQVGHPLVKKIAKSINEQRSSIKKDIRIFRSTIRKDNLKEKSLLILEKALVQVCQSGIFRKQNEDYLNEVWKSYMEFDDGFHSRMESVGSDLGVSEREDSRMIVGDKGKNINDEWFVFDEFNHLREEENCSRLEKDLVKCKSLREIEETKSAEKNDEGESGRWGMGTGRTQGNPLVASQKEKTWAASTNFSRSSNFWDLVNNSKLARVKKSSLDLGYSRILKYELESWRKTLKSDHSTRLPSEKSRQRDIRHFFVRQNLWYESIRTEVISCYS